MPFTDPRRTIVRGEQREDVSILKTTGLMAAVSIAGIRLSDYFTSQRLAVEANIAQAKAATEKGILLFSNNDLQIDEYGQMVDKVWYHETEFKYDPSKEWQEHFEKLEREEGAPINRLTPEELSDSLYKLSELVDQTSSVLEHRQVTNYKEASRILAMERGRQWRQLYKEYPEMFAILSEIDGITIKKVTQTGTDFKIHINDGSTTQILNLPKWKSGIVYWNGSIYSPKMIADKSADKIVMDSFGFSVGARLKELVTRGYFAKDNKARELKRVLDNTISIYAGDYAGEGHILKHLVSSGFIFDQITSKYGSKPSEGRSQALDDLAISAEDYRIYIRTSERSLSKLNEVFRAQLPYPSIRAISDQAFVGSAAGRSALPWAGPLTPWNKSSQFRANFMAGRYMPDGTRYRPEEIAARLGPTATDVVRHLSRHMNQTLPGKMTNIGVYTGSGELKGMGPGGSTFIVRNMLDPRGKVAKERWNVREYDGVKRNQFKIPLAIEKAWENTADTYWVDIDGTLLSAAMDERWQRRAKKVGPRSAMKWLEGQYITDLRKNKALVQKLKELKAKGAKINVLTNRGFSQARMTLKNLGKYSRLFDNFIFCDGTKGAYKVEGVLFDNEEKYAGVADAFVHVKNWEDVSKLPDELRATTLGINKSTARLISELGNRARKGEVVLRKGEWLGDIGTEGSVRIDDDARVIGMTVDKGYLTISTESDKFFGAISKIDQNKAMIMRVELANNVGSLFKGLAEGEANHVADLMSQSHLTAELGTELIINLDQVSKYRGGMLGWGIIQKTMSDLVNLKKLQWGRVAKNSDLSFLNKENRLSIKKQLWEVLETFLGPDIHQVVADVGVSPDTHTPYIFLKSRLGKDKMNATMADAAFYRVIDIEKAVMDAEKGNFKALEEYAARINPIMQKHTGISWEMVSTRHEAEMLNRVEQDWIPVVARTAVSLGDNKSMMKMTGLFFQSSVFHHQQSAYNYSSTAGLLRSKAGYVGGVKATIEHMEIARASGLVHYHEYLHTLLDYNMDYVRDKLFTAEQHMLGPRYDMKKVPGSFVKTKGIKLVTQAMLDEHGLNARLAQYSIHSEALKSAGRWRIIGKELSSLQGAIDDPEIAELIDSGIISFEDIRNTAKASQGRYSVDITGADVVHDMVKLMQNAAPDEAVYMELPEIVNIGGKEVKYVPIHRFDLADSFELESMRLPGGESKVSDVYRKFYTGSRFWTNQMYFVKEMARIKTELVEHKKHRKNTDYLKNNIRDLVEMYYKNLNDLTSGSQSPLVSSMFDYRMPFSARGVVNAAAEERDVKGITQIEGIPTDSVFMHEDDVAKLISGGKVESLSHAKRMIGQLEAVTDTVKRLKGLNIDSLTMDNLDTYSEDIMAIGKSVSRMSAEVWNEIGNQNADYMRGLGSRTRKVGALTKAVSGKGKLQKLKEVLHSMRLSNFMSNNEGKLDEFKRTTAIYKYTYDTVNKMKDNKLTLYGSLEGDPHLSQLSLDFFKLKILESREFSTSTMESNVRNLIKKHEASLTGKGRGAIYASKEMIKAINRDFDRDPIGFVVRTLDLLEAESNKIAGFSILKEASLLGVKGRDVHMAMFHDLTKETLMETIMSRLALVENSVEGGPVLRPASITAITTMSALEDAQKESRVSKVGVLDYIEKSLNEMCSDKEIQTLAGRSGSRKTLVKELAEKIEGKAKRFLGNKATLSNLSVMEEVSRTIKGVGYISNQTLTDMHRLAKEYPELLSQGAGLTISDGALKAKDALSAIDAKRFQAYIDEVRREESPRFKQIKDQTPKAYNTAKALYALNYGYITEEADKAFLVNLADKVIAQNVISSKHGSPQVLLDLANTLRELGSTRSDVLDSTLKNLARGNWKLAVTEAEKDEMKFWLNGKVEDVDLDLYSQYINTKHAFLYELSKHHETVTAEFARSRSLRNQTTAQVEKVYTEKVKSLIDSSMMVKSRKEPFNLPDLLYSKVVTAEELRRTTEAVGTVKKFKKLITMGLTEDESKKKWRMMVSAMREYHDINGTLVFDDPYNNIVRSFEGRDKSMARLLQTLVNNNIARRDDAGNLVSRASNYISSQILRYAAILGDFGDVTLETEAFSDRVNRHIYMAGREVRRAQKQRLDRTITESSVFRTGSILESLEGKISKVTASASEDLSLRKVGKSKGSSLLIGLLAGTIIGQSINQLTSGYAVPDLGGRREGLGGEYYDKRRRYLGRELEVMLKERPNRIAPNDIYENVVNRELRALTDSQTVSGTNIVPKQLEPYLKGSIIR